MKKIIVILQLMRWSNLVFIALTQCLFYYSLFFFSFKYYREEFISAHLSPRIFIFVLAATLFIAAAGYIINDYFDIHIDEINKPDKVIIGKKISSRPVFFLYLAFSTLGIFLSFYIAFSLKNYLILLLNTLSVLALYVYSAVLKRKLLWGNLIISLLAAWVILVLAVAEYQSDAPTAPSSLILKLSFLYGGFAFITTFIREILKDMEDAEGDKQYGCATLPVVTGMSRSKKIVRYSLILTIILIMFSLTPLFYSANWAIGGYCIFFIIWPLFIIFRGLPQAATSDDFHKLSSFMKIVMLTGTVSMIFFNMLSI